MAEKTITVTKTATEKVAADWVVVSVSAVGESKKYAEAADKADSVADAAVAALKAVVGADVRAHGINVGAIRDGKKTVGYRAVRTFSVEFDYDKKTLAAVLDALAESSCEFGVSFSLKDKELHADLLARAVKAARADAEIIAAAAGVKLGNLSSVEYSSNDCRPMMMRAAAFDGANGAEPERVTLSETVTCSFFI